MASRPKISVKSRRNVFVRKIEISDTLKSDATVPPPFLHCSMVSLSARLCWNVTPEGLTRDYRIARLRKRRAKTKKIVRISTNGGRHARSFLFFVSHFF